MRLSELFILAFVANLNTIFGASYRHPQQNSNNYFSGSSPQVWSDVWTPISVTDSTSNPALIGSMHPNLNSSVGNIAQQPQAQHRHNNSFQPAKQTFAQMPHFPSPVAEVKNNHQRVIQFQRQSLPKPLYKHNKRRRGRHPLRGFPNLFLRKTSRKVFFPSDRRTSLDRPLANPNQGVPNYKFRFDSTPQYNNNKGFSGAGAHGGISRMPIQNISNRLRMNPVRFLCVFQTVSVGMHGERCIEL